MERRGRRPFADVMIRKGRIKAHQTKRQVRWHVLRSRLRGMYTYGWKLSYGDSPEELAGTGTKAVEYRGILWPLSSSSELLSNSVRR